MHELVVARQEGWATRASLALAAGLCCILCRQQVCEALATGRCLLWWLMVPQVLQIGVSPACLAAQGCEASGATRF